MGIISNFFKRGKTDTEQKREASVYVACSYSNDSALTEVTTDYTAMQIAAVFRCVQVLGDSVAQLRCRYLRMVDGVYKEVVNDPLHYLLTIAPNKHQSSYDFMKAVVNDILLHGNAFIFPKYSPTGDVNELVLLSHGSVNYDWEKGIYKVNDWYNHISGTFDEWQIIHIKGQSLDGHIGLSVISYASTVMSAAATGDNETLNRFSTGGNVRGFVGNDTSVKGFGEYADSELNKAAADIDAQFRAGRRIVPLHGQVDFRPVSLSSTDMQFLESRKFSVKEIARFFGIPMQYLFEESSSNYKDAENANLAFLNMTLNPLLRNIEAEFQRKLISRNLCHRYTIRYDRREMWAADMLTRADYQAKTIANGVYTINDWRTFEGLPVVNGGDETLVSANLKTLRALQAEGPVEIPDESDYTPNMDIDDPHNTQE